MTETVPEHGPFQTEREARETAAVQAVYAAFEADDEARMMPRNLAVLAAACEAAGIDLGAYDEQILCWLANYEPEMCAVVAGIIRRAARPPEGTVTQWAIRVADPDSGRTDESMPVASEEVVRAAVPAWRRGGWAEVAVVSRQVTPWTEAPKAAREDGDGPST